MNRLDDPPGTSLNGAAHGELLDRVQQLRLDGQLGAAKDARPRNAPWLPWILAAALALAWAGMGLRTYRNAPADGGNLAIAPVNPSPGSVSTAGASPPFCTPVFLTPAQPPPQPVHKVCMPFGVPP